MQRVNAGSLREEEHSADPQRDAPAIRVRKTDEYAAHSVLTSELAPDLSRSGPTHMATSQILGRPMSTGPNAEIVGHLGKDLACGFSKPRQVQHFVLLTRIVFGERRAMQLQFSVHI